MSTRFVSAGRNRPMGLPPGPWDWIPQDDLAPFVVEAAQGLNLSAFHVNARGAWRFTRNR